MLEVCIFSGFFAQNFHFLAVRWCFSTHINPWTFGHVPCIEDRKDVVDIRPANTKESTHLGYSANKQFEEEKSLNYIQSYGDGARIKDRNFYNYRLIAFNHIISSKNVHVWMHNTYIESYIEHHHTYCIFSSKYVSLMAWLVLRRRAQSNRNMAGKEPL